MILRETGQGSKLGDQWITALYPLDIRHPDSAPVVELELLHGDPPQLAFRLDAHRDTVKPSKVHRPFNVSTVSLTYFPGARVARAWVAAAWAGYVMHEALELVTANGARPIDPHADVTHDVCLRDGLPAVLTPESLRTALSVVMRPSAVAELLGD